MKEKAPTFKSDKVVEEYLDQDLTDYINPHKTSVSHSSFFPKSNQSICVFRPNG